jgi:hypothetical protein
MAQMDREQPNGWGGFLLIRFGNDNGRIGHSLYDEGWPALGNRPKSSASRCGWDDSYALMGPCKRAAPGSVFR